MRTLAAAVLAFEAVVIVLVVPVAITLGGVDATTAIVVGVVAFVGCIVTAALLRHRWAYVLGSLVQVFLIACGVVIPVPLSAADHPAAIVLSRAPGRRQADGFANVADTA